MICRENPEVEVEVHKSGDHGAWARTVCPTSGQLLIQKCSYSKMKIGCCPIWLEEQMARKVILQLWPQPLLQCVLILCTNNGTKIKKNTLCSCLLECVQKTLACWNSTLTLGFLLPWKHTISFLTDPLRWNLALLVKAVSDVWSSCWWRMLSQSAPHPHPSHFVWRGDLKLKHLPKGSPYGALWIS